MANIRHRSDENTAYTALIWPREGGGAPKLVWILEETPNGFLVEEVAFRDNGGHTPKQVLFPHSLYTRDEREAQTTMDVAASMPKLGPWPLVRP